MRPALLGSGGELVLIICPERTLPVAVHEVDKAVTAGKQLPHFAVAQYCRLLCGDEAAAMRKLALYKCRRLGVEAFKPRKILAGVDLHDVKSVVREP